MLIGRRQVDATAVSRCHDRQEPHAQPSCLSLSLDVVAGYRRARHQAPKVRPSRQLRPRLGRIRRRTHLHREPVPPPVGHRLDVRLLPLLRRQHERRRQRHVHVGERRVRTLHRPRPQPRDHRQLAAHVRLQVGPLAHHVRRDLDRRIQMPDPLLRLVAHPPAVVAHILGQPLRPAPRLRDHRPIRPRRRVHR